MLETGVLDSSDSKKIPDSNTVGLSFANIAKRGQNEDHVRAKFDTQIPIGALRDPGTIEFYGSVL